MQRFKSGLLLIGFLYGLFVSTLVTTPAFAAIANTPLFLTQAVDPRVLFVASRDHQLYIKAYTDYSDLNGDGVLDTTYTDNVEYYGYFDSKKCYSYTNSRFEPSSAASGPNNHHCSAQWSGNFLNWATMTRMDVIRKVLYGGYRSTDTASTTVLERVVLPIDVHAFSKVFKTSSTSEMQKYVPYSQTEISICNLTNALSGLVKDVNTSSTPPLMRIAKGSWPRWAASEVKQCQWGLGTQPAIIDQLAVPDLNVRILACVPGLLESNCKAYPNKTTAGTNNYKPAGLLQKYGEAAKPLKIGLFTGSYQKNKSGGVLRDNIGAISGNATASLNEIDTDGIFINQGTSDPGIINTLNRFRISSYDYSTNKYLSSCNSPGILSFTDGQCVDWGNPLSEIYLEALRYLAGKTSPTTAFNAADSTFISSLPQLSWQDPMPQTEWCANNSIITVSTGLNSFDRDQLSNDLGINATNETNTVGTLENITGSYLIGGNGSTSNNQCTAKSLSGLADAEGICPEVPSLKGGYHIAGLAYYANTHDMRSDRQKTQTVTTYSVALAESLPRFDISAGSGTVTLLPACEANSTGSATASTSNWRVCSMTDLIVESMNYSNGKLVSGSFLVNWEDSSWGNDYDMDGIERLAFCAGSSCTNFTVQCPTTSNANATITMPAVGSNQVAITTCAAQAVAGHALRFGYTITGSTNDGIYLPVLRPGNNNFIVGNTLPSTVTAPTQTTFSQGASAGKLLENPLWYTAKYGSFIEIDDKNNPKPNLAAEWDADSDGVPDGFFKASNPAKLEQSLDSILSDVVKRSSSASAVATNSTRLDTGTLIYQAKFNSGDWSGHLLAYQINPDGSIGILKWDAADHIPAPSIRNIFSYNPTATGTKGISFLWNNLNSTQQAALHTLNGTNDSKGPDRLNYLRGDQSKEQASGPFRKRSVLLGDIINSDPWFVGTENFGYHRLPSPEGPAYTTFRNGSSYTGRRKMVYVGANDGMLHGFDAANDTTNGGKEIFAYIPDAIIGKLSKLTDPTYGATTNSHQYLVDGAPKAGDAYINGAWKTLLAGTLGAGGKGVFVLDVTNPDGFDATDVLWEVTDTTDPEYADLGYTLPQPSIVRLANGDWGVIVANGYDSASKKAVLYILDAEDGSIIKKFDTLIGNVSNPNGLSTPITVDKDNDRIVDVIFAGDLQGNLWEFDVSDSAGASAWDFAYGGAGPEPFFVACSDQSNCANTRQPITAKPQVGKGPNGQGIMVYFGTGKYFETGDNIVGPSPQVQTYYALRENGAQVSGRSVLQEQTILAEGTVGSTPVRVTSDSDVDYNNNQEGWYMDLTPPSPSSPAGERVVAPSLLRGGRIIFVSIIPEPNPCSFGGTSWLYELDALSGSRLSTAQFDVNGDGKIDKADLVQILDTNNDGVVDANDDIPPSGKELPIGISKNPSVIPAGDYEYKYSSGTTGGIAVTKEKGAEESGRLSWRQLQ